MSTIDEKTKVSLFLSITVATVAIPAIVGYAIFIYGVAADAKKGARAARIIPQIAWDLKQIKKAQKIKDEPVPEYLIKALETEE